MNLAEKAKELRELHLGNEVRNHEYFIENLNKEVENVENAIKQKNLDRKAHV